jgi:hypothetical protein
MDELVNQLTALSIKQLGIAESTFKNYLTDIYKNCEIMFDLVKPKNKVVQLFQWQKQGLS